jgi:polyisoprenoid-binding protein YceI
LPSGCWPPQRHRRRDWQVDPAHSTVKFSGTQDGQPFSASFKTFTADVSFDPADLAASKVTVTLPIAALVADAPMIQQEIAGADWFDARQLPRRHLHRYCFQES